MVVKRKESEKMFSGGMTLMAYAAGLKFSETGSVGPKFIFWSGMGLLLISTLLTLWED